MTQLIYSVIESPAHPDLSAGYKSLGMRELKFNSQRKAIAHLKREKPDWVIAEFYYGYGNNYAGANVSNLDVLLHSLQKYAPQAKTIVLVPPREKPHIDKLTTLFDIHATLPLPFNPLQMRDLLQEVSE